jgi:hypothetical protein
MFGFMELFPLNTMQFNFLSDILEVLLKAITDEDPNTVIAPTLPAAGWLCGN